MALAARSELFNDGANALLEAVLPLALVLAKRRQLPPNARLVGIYAR